MGNFKKIMVVLLVLLQVVFAGEALASSFLQDLAGIDINRSAHSVLKLYAFDKDDQITGNGCGFVSYDENTLVTSCHILKEADWIMAVNEDGNEYIVSSVIAADEKKDIAFLEFLSPSDLRPLSLSGGVGLNQDDPVVVICNPYGSLDVAVQGKINEIYEEEGISYIRFTADIPGGSSGGALFDVKGRIIGIIKRSQIDSNGMNLAVNISEVLRLKTEGFENERKTFAEFFGREEKQGLFPFPIPKPGSAVLALVQSALDLPESAYQVPAYVKAALSGENIKIIWDGVKGADQYNIYRSEQKERGFELVDVTSQTEYIDANIEYAAYYYQISSQKGNEGSTLSGTAGVIPQYELNKNLAAPRSVKAKTSKTSATITWGKVKNAQRYMVLRSDKKDGVYDFTAMVKENKYVDESVIRGVTYYYKVRSVTGREMSNLSNAVKAKMPNAAPTPKPTATPYIEPDYFVQVSNRAMWEKRKGSWRVNPKVANASKTSTVDSVTLTYYCEDILGNIIVNENTGEYFSEFTYDKTIKPKKSIYPGYATLEGYKDVVYINVAVTKVHTTDGRTITYPELEWQFGVIEMD